MRLLVQFPSKSALHEMFTEASLRLLDLHIAPEWELDASGFHTVSVRDLTFQESLRVLILVSSFHYPTQVVITAD